mmetsp:Transcript_74543/g.189140  ORF Transcript_74543/g.189140 Transcript_74543/m.189140 type:complete len:103 (+) Transcript_74543:332-640(+)
MAAASLAVAVAVLVAHRTASAKKPTPRQDSVALVTQRQHGHNRQRPRHMRNQYTQLPERSFTIEQRLQVLERYLHVGRLRYEGPQIGVRDAKTLEIGRPGPS